MNLQEQALANIEYKMRKQNIEAHTGKGLKTAIRITYLKEEALELIGFLQELKEQFGGSGHFRKLNTKLMQEIMRNNTTDRIMEIASEHIRHLDNVRHNYNDTMQAYRNVMTFRDMAKVKRTSRTAYQIGKQRQHYIDLQNAKMGVGLEYNNVYGLPSAPKTKSDRNNPYHKDVVK